MATFLDIGLLRHFIVIFPLLLVFVGTYAILTKLEIVGKDKGISAIIAFSVACMFLFIQDALTVLTVLTPWFVLFIFVLFFILLIFEFMGVEESTIQEVMQGEWGTIHWIIIAIVLVIAMGGLSQVYGPRLAAGEGFSGGEVQVDPVTGEPVGPEGGGNVFEDRVENILFHPQVIGMVVLLLIITFAIRFLATEHGDDDSSDGDD